MRHDSSKRRRKMEWTTPNFEEVQLCCEINTYANAEF